MLYFTDYITTLPREDVIAFVRDPVDLFENKHITPISDWLYNISFKENKGFWSYTMNDLCD